MKPHVLTVWLRERRMGGTELAFLVEVAASGRVNELPRAFLAGRTLP